MGTSPGGPILFWGNCMLPIGLLRWKPDADEMGLGWTGQDQESVAMSIFFIIVSVSSIGNYPMGHPGPCGAKKCVIGQEQCGASAVGYPCNATVLLGALGPRRPLTAATQIDHWQRFEAPASFITTYPSGIPTHYPITTVFLSDNHRRRAVFPRIPRRRRLFQTPRLVLVAQL